jgi:3-deoxy-7-phosphoheptulonate synthase
MFGDPVQAMLRGGAFKPRTSPYAFQGLGKSALEILADVRSQTGMPIVTEVLDTRHVELVAGYADVMQVGARNMQNFALLAELGRIQRPVLLKRGMSATVPEFLMAAEYIMAHGNSDVVLCERGIRTFDQTMTRNTLDVAVVPVLKQENASSGNCRSEPRRWPREPRCPTLIRGDRCRSRWSDVEVHPTPENALTDGDQSLSPAEFEDMMRTLDAFALAAGRTTMRTVTQVVA